MVCWPTPSEDRRQLRQRRIGNIVNGRFVIAKYNPLAPKPPHFAAKAKSVIFLFCYGGPSQVDLFDPKPALEKWHGQPIPVFANDGRLL